MRDDFTILLLQDKKDSDSGLYNLMLTPKKEGMNIKKVIL